MAVPNSYHAPVGEKHFRDNTAKWNKRLLTLATCYVCKQKFLQRRFSMITHKGAVAVVGKDMQRRMG
jgi:hypothetical protein